MENAAISNEDSSYGLNGGEKRVYSGLCRHGRVVRVTVPVPVGPSGSSSGGNKRPREEESELSRKITQSSPNRNENNSVSVRESDEVCGKWHGGVWENLMVYAHART